MISMKITELSKSCSNIYTVHNLNRSDYPFKGQSSFTSQIFIEKHLLPSSHGRR